MGVTMQGPLQALANVLVFIINLERQCRRRDNTVELLTASGLNRPAVFPAVDGRALYASGGRLRRMKKFWRICYDDTNGEDSSRITDKLRISDLASAGAIDIRSKYGCKKSHEAILRMVLRPLPREEFILVFEDDVMLGRMCGGPQALLPTLADFTERLTQAHPERVALLLGGSPVFGQAAGTHALL